MRGELEPAPVPYLGRMILVPAVLAHVFALAGLLPGWPDYRVPWAAAVLLAVSMGLPVLLVVVPRRGRGRLPAGAAAVVVAGVFAVSVAVPVLLPPHLRGSLQAWNWGTGAMTLLGIAAYLPTRRTIALAFAHAGLAVAVQLLSGGGPWRLHLVLVATLVPPLGAAQFLRSYADALRQRSLAVSERLEAERGRLALDAVRWSGHQRLGVLRDEIEPLLRHVAEGGPLPLDQARAHRARLLAERLRAALVAGRRTLWLPEQVGDAPVRVICSDAAAGAVGATDRAWLAALLELLDTYPRWRAVHVVLDLDPDGVVHAVVTTEGPAAAEAVAEPRVRALVARVGARVDIDGSILIIDADLNVTIGA